MSHFEPSLSSYLSQVRAYTGSIALLTAWKVGLFDRLVEGDGDLLFISRGCSCSLELLSRLVDVLEDMGLVVRHEQTVALSESGRAIYDDETCNAFSRYHSFCHTGWTRLEGLLREHRGAGAGFHRHLRQTSPEFVKSYLRAMECIARHHLRFVLERWKMENVRRLVDIGCGPATISRGWGCKHSGSMVVGIDLHPIPEAARSLYSYPSNFTWITADFMDLQHDQGYDGVYCGHLLQYCSESRLVDWISKMHGLASPGGRGAILAFLRQDQSREPGPARLSQSLHALESCINGEDLGTIHTTAAIRSCLQDHADDIEFVRTPLGATHPEMLVTFVWK